VATFAAAVLLEEWGAARVLRWIICERIRRLDSSRMRFISEVLVSGRDESRPET